MIDEPVPTMPEIVPAISPTTRTKRKAIRSPQPSLRATGSHECAPDDKLREAIHLGPRKRMDCFVASLLAMTEEGFPTHDSLLLTPYWQQAQVMTSAIWDHLERADHGHQGKLPLRQHAI